MSRVFHHSGCGVSHLCFVLGVFRVFGVFAVSISVSSRPHFFSEGSLVHCGCLSELLPKTETLLAGPGLEVPPVRPTVPGTSMLGATVGLGSPAPPTPTPGRTPTPAPGPAAAAAPSRLADCSTASECSRAFIRRAATLAVRLP